MKNESTNYIIQADNISLTYKIHSSFSLKKLFTKTELNFKQITHVDALQDVSFHLVKGHNLGILGTNGSGKSTLLRVISQTFKPDIGSIKINTDQIQLLSLGVGFLDDLSGRDNLYLNALLLGLDRSLLDNGLAEEIIEFSELGNAIDLPMYTYSSGMRSRLTFSVAACVKPNLLLLDEVFSVGDAHFKIKSQKRIEQMIKSDKTVIMISHDKDYIKDHCDQALWLHKGKLQMLGNPFEVAKEYEKFTKSISNG